MTSEPKPSKDDAARHERSQGAGIWRVFSFWPVLPVLREMKWFEPPLPPTSEPIDDTHPLRLLRELARMVPHLTTRAWHLIWHYSTRSAAASDELAAGTADAREALRRRNEVAAAELSELRPDLQRLEREHSQAERDLSQAYVRMTAAFATAGLPLPGPAPAEASVDGALQTCLPTLEEMSGRHGVAPPTEFLESPTERAVGQAMGSFCAIASGTVLAASVGALSGALSFDGADDPTAGVRFVGLVIIGCLLSRAAGELYARTTRSVAAALETLPSGCPRLRARPLVPGVLVALAVCVCGAMLTIDALGIRQLQALYLQSHPGDFTLPPLLPWPVYFVQAAAITGAYLGWKVSGSWRCAEREARESWLAWLQWEWLEERRSKPEVQAAVLAASAYQDGRLRLAALSTRLQALRERQSELQPITEFDTGTKATLRALREAAVGERRGLDLFVQELLRMAEASPEHGGGPFGDTRPIWTIALPSIGIGIVAAVSVAAIRFTLGWDASAGEFPGEIGRTMLYSGTLGAVVCASAAAWASLRDRGQATQASMPLLRAGEGMVVGTICGFFPDSLPVGIQWACLGALLGAAVGPRHNAIDRFRGAVAGAAAGLGTAILLVVEHVPRQASSGSVLAAAVFGAAFAAAIGAELSLRRPWRQSAAGSSRDEECRSYYDQYNSSGA